MNQIFMLIIANLIIDISILQLLPGLWGPFYTAENLSEECQDWYSLIISRRWCGALSVILKYLIGKSEESISLIDQSKNKEIQSIKKFKTFNCSVK